MQRQTWSTEPSQLLGMGFCSTWLVKYQKAFEFIEAWCSSNHQKVKSGEPYLEALIFKGMNLLTYNFRQLCYLAKAYLEVSQKESTCRSHK